MDGSYPSLDLSGYGHVAQDFSDGVGKTLISKRRIVLIIPLSRKLNMRTVGKEKQNQGKQPVEDTKEAEGDPSPGDANANKDALACKGKKKISLNVARLKARLAGVQSNITNLHCSFLFGTIIVEALEIKAIRKKIRYDWKFLEGGFQVIPTSSNWFELKLDLPADKERVWQGRPYHILSQLLLLKPWRIDFDPEKGGNSVRMEMMNQPPYCHLMVSLLVMLDPEKGGIFMIIPCILSKLAMSIRLCTRFVAADWLYRLVSWLVVQL